MHVRSTLDAFCRNGKIQTRSGVRGNLLTPDPMPPSKPTTKKPVRWELGHICSEYSLSQSVHKWQSLEVTTFSFPVILTGDICEITNTYKTHLPDEEKRKYEMLSHEKKVIKSIHLQNDYGITRLRHRQQIKATTKAWNRCIEKMEKILDTSD